MINDQYYRRRFVIGGITVGIVLVYIIRLFYIQIVDRDLMQMADSNALVRQTIYPARGLIYDRNDTLLVFNQPIYEITIIESEMGTHFDTLAFCNTLQLTRDDFDQRMTEIKDRKKNRGYSSYTPQVFLGQQNKTDIAYLQETLFQFPGVHINKRTLRDYAYPAAAQVLGSVGEVNQRDIDNDDYYARGDYSGRDGIELTYESTLRGQKGVNILLRNSKGQIKGSYHGGERDVPAQAGQDLHITLDIQLQMLAEQLLSGKVGSVVAIEPQSGEVLALTSSPTWDPAILVGKERAKNYSALLADKSKPLFNRATQATYPPGSTFKLIQALVCLQEGGITPATAYPCNGPASAPIKCTHHHGSPVSLEGAIEQSCNPYFWNAFRDMLQKDGYGDRNEAFRRRYQLWRDDVMQFGFGQRFADSDIGNQVSGSIPGQAFYDRYYGKAGWKAITIRSLSIGQGEILVTPLQLANQAAAIANEGYYITPHLNKSDSLKSDKHIISIDPQYFRIVKEGMHRVMVYGTGRHYPIEQADGTLLATCGKTGTVQNPHGKDHAIFIGFAPMDNPQIAVAVVVENAGFGATWAAPIASLLIEQYINGAIKRTELKKRIASTKL